MKGNLYWIVIWVLIIGGSIWRMGIKEEPAHPIRRSTVTKPSPPPTPTPTPQQYTVTVTPESFARMRARNTDERDDQIAELEAQVKEMESNQSALQKKAEQAQRNMQTQRIYKMRTQDGERIKIMPPAGMEGQRIEMKTEDGNRVHGFIY